MSSDSEPLDAQGPESRGSRSYKEGHAFEHRVAETYRLLGYRVEHGRIFAGRQVDIFLELTLADLRVRRAVECKTGPVDADDIDKFIIKLKLVQREFPDALGAIVGALSFTDQVAAHAAAMGIQLTLYRDLSAQILDGPSYAQRLIREIEENERYRPALFVEPLIGHETRGEGRRAFEVVGEWLGDARWNQLTLLGDVGTGKSFLCRMIALRLARTYLERPTEAPLPLLIDLRNADREFSLEGLVLTHFAGHGLARATFASFQFLLSEGRIVLILDGFDEMASRVTPTVTTRNFHELARSVKRNAKVLLSCRTHYFKSRTEEEEVVLGGSGPQSSDVARDLYWDLIARRGFKIEYLRPFSMPQVEEYVEKACPEAATIVLEKIRAIYNLAELSQRPLLLEMIVRSIDKFTTLEVTSAQLYEVFTDAWIFRDRWRDVLGPEQKLKFLTALARSLWEQEKTAIDYQKLQEYVEAELSGVIDSPQKLIELDGEIRTASFLVRDDEGHYGFAHSSYSEYFLARDLATHVSAGDLSALETRRLTNEVIDFVLWMVDKAALEEMLTAVLRQAYRPLLSENALVILYRLRRNLLVEEKSRGDDAAGLRVEMPSNAQLQGAKLAQVNIEGAILHAAQLTGAELHQCVARGVDLAGSSLARASIRKGDFQGASLSNVDATQAVMAEVNFHLADVRGCNFRGADLSSAMFTVKDFCGATFQDASFESAVLPSGRESEISGRRVSVPDSQSGSDRERTLVRAFKLAKKYAARQGAGADSPDIASDVVLFLLSNPAELTRLDDAGSGLDDFVRTLTWRKVTGLRRAEPVRLGHGVSDLQDEGTADEHEGWFYGPWDGYQISYSGAEESLVGGVEAPWMDLIEGGSENAELLQVLGKSLSREALQMLIARYIDEETVEEIARRLELSEVEVVRRLNKARELARVALRSL